METRTTRNRHTLRRHTTFNGRHHIPRHAILLVRRSRLAIHQTPHQTPQLIRRRRPRRPRRFYFKRRFRRRSARTGHFTNRVFANRLNAGQHQVTFIRRRVGRPRGTIRTLKRLNRQQRLVQSLHVAGFHFNTRSTLNGNHQHQRGHTNSFFNNRITSFTRNRQRLNVHHRNQITADRSRTRTVIFRIFIAPINLLRFFRLDSRRQPQNIRPHASTRRIGHLRTPHKRRPHTQVNQRTINLPAHSNSRGHFIRHLLNRIRVTRRTSRHHRGTPQIFTVGLLSPHFRQFNKRRSNVPSIADIADQSELYPRPS